jgi:hypothetical protein
MPKCTHDKIDFGCLGRRPVEADFSSEDLSSDGGLLLLRQIDEHLGLSRAAAAASPDSRDPERIRHGLRQMLAQRRYGLCCGYVDLIDHKTLRGDLLMQTAARRDEALASAPTFSRLESRATRAQALGLHGVMLDQFVASHAIAPVERELGIDVSAMPLHGAQALSQCHAYAACPRAGGDQHCYLPL